MPVVLIIQWSEWIPFAGASIHLLWELGRVTRAFGELADVWNEQYQQRQEPARSDLPAVTQPVAHRSVMASTRSGVTPPNCTTGTSVAEPILKIPGPGRGPATKGARLRDSKG
ncbi:hypothetical protein QF030_007787 [Streptomyces rishiriensis]|uniref:Uncharacterized protein n=1 Tax=Streptomyces rishiriensis TaxID=68264 RepID=A0ABU0P2L5_STRRH|nr:hypothetical protein [Streptomyces rishiriensis]